VRPRVVITGVGAITPYGAGADLLHSGWSAGHVAIEGGQARCEGFDPSPYLSRKECAMTDRFTQLMVVAADEAVGQSEWAANPPCEADDVGAVIGVTVGGVLTVEAQYQVLQERGSRHVSPLSIPRIMPSSASAMLAIRYGFGGATYQVGSACASASTAIVSAVRAIQAGDTKACLAGGADAPFSRFSRACFNATGVVSPSGTSRPFDARRDGFVMGEGAAVLALEDERNARQRGAQVLGEVLGVGSSSDHSHLVAPEPSGRGAAKAIARALTEAGLEPADLDYVNAQGTATVASDAAETRALKLALGEDGARGVPVSSTKSAIGHLMGAAGAVEAVATLMALRNRVAPPNLGYGEPDPECDLDYVTDGARGLRGRTLNGRGAVGVSNSFGFGGHNVVLCLRAN
jgi:3-oxoacyl-[acyl-carrier-protein] synthase II